MVNKIAGAASVRVYGYEHGVGVRDTSAGVNTLTFFLATNTVHLFDIVLYPLVFAGISFAFISYSISFAILFAMLLGTAW